MQVFFITLLLSVMLLSVILLIDWLMGLSVGQMIQRLKNSFWMMDPMELWLLILLICLPFVKDTGATDKNGKTECHKLMEKVDSSPEVERRRV